jgi:hypothetical protein
MSDWLTDLDLISAGNMAEIDGYVGYEQPYATSHKALETTMPCSKTCEPRRPRFVVPSSSRPKINTGSAMRGCIPQSKMTTNRQTHGAQTTLEKPNPRKRKQARSRSACPKGSR